MTPETQAPSPTQPNKLGDLTSGENEPNREGVALDELVSAMRSMASYMRTTIEFDETPSNRVHEAINRSTGPMWQSLSPDQQRFIMQIIEAIGDGISESSYRRFR